MFFKSVFLFLTIMVATALPSRAETLRVVTEDWPPYNYCENGEAKGVVTEVVRKALENAGLDYTIEVLPWARAFELARTEPNVLIYSILKLPNRASLFKWVKLDGLSIEMSLYRPRFRSDINIQTLDDAKKYKVGVTRDSSTHHFLLSSGFKEGKNLFPVRCELLNILKSQPQTVRVDLTTGDRISLNAFLKQAGLPANYWVEAYPLFKKDLYMAFNPATPETTVQRISEALAKVRPASLPDGKPKKLTQLSQ